MVTSTPDPLYPRTEGQKKLEAAIQTYKLDRDFIFGHVQPMGGGRLANLVEYIISKVEGNTYLDDPDHDWSLQPTAARSIKAEVLHLAEHANADDILTVLRGYHGLKQRHPTATDQECFGTSMIWMFG